MRMRKRVLSVALCFMMAVACLMPAVNVKADGGKTTIEYKKNKTYVLMKYKNDIRYRVDFGEKLNDTTSISSSSSKKSVVKIEKGYYMIKCLSGDGTYDNTKYGYFIVQPKQAGTTKIKVKVKKDGKNYTYTFKIKVVNYTNPFKSVKAGKKALTYKFYKSPHYSFTFTEKNAKFSMKSAKNWKMKKIEYRSYNPNTSKYETKRVKNGFKIPTIVKGKKGKIIITMQNKKTKAVETFYLTLSAK